MKTTQQFTAWYLDSVERLTATIPGKWLAVDGANNTVVDEDDDSNRLIERVLALPMNQRLRTGIVYVFPPEFV